MEDTHLSFLLMSAKGIGAGAFLGTCGLLMARLLVFLTTGATSSSLSSSSLVSFLTTFLFFLRAFRSARDSSCSSSSPPTVFCRHEGEEVSQGGDQSEQAGFKRGEKEGNVHRMQQPSWGRQ